MFCSAPHASGYTKKPKDGALNSALYSNYKNTHTVKFLVLTTLDSYISYISPAMNGGSTDNGCMIELDVANTFA